eukprot:7378556-Prymnesium_polylepis.1
MQHAWKGKIPHSNVPPALYGLRPAALPPPLPQADPRRAPPRGARPAQDAVEARHQEQRLRRCAREDLRRAQGVEARPGHAAQGRRS